MYDELNRNEIVASVETGEECLCSLDAVRYEIEAVGHQRRFIDHRVDCL